MDRYGAGVFLIAALVPSGCGPMGPAGPSRAEAQRAGEEACRPIIAALERYHSAHGRYPDRLGDLVRSKLIDRIPDTPEIGRSKWSGIEYEVSLPIDVYCLSFSYDIPDALFGAIFRFSYWSDQAEWTSRKYPPSFWSETCGRAAKRYRENRYEAALRAFIATVTARPDFEYFYERRVKEWLGEGEPKAIPREVSAGERIGSCYGSRDGTTKICFIYKSRESTSLEGEKEAYLILDTLDEIGIQDGRERWRVLLRSP